MEIAAYIMAGVMIGATIYVLRAATLQILAQKSRIVRDLFKAGDNVDRLKQQIRDKNREITKLVDELIPKTTEEIAEAARETKTHKRKITEAETSLEQRANGWDTRITALEEAGILAGPYIIRPGALKFKHVEFFVAHGYTTLNAGDLPLAPDANPERPANPVRETWTRITKEEKNKKATDRRLLKRATSEIENMVRTEPTRRSFEEANKKKQKKRGGGWRGLRELVSGAARRDQGSKNETGPADPQHRAPSEKRSTRKGTT